MDEPKHNPAAERASRPEYPVRAPDEEHAQEGTELGAVRVHHGVMAVIARLATMKVAGVVDMSGSFTDGLAGMIGKQSAERGIKVQADERGLGLELNIVVEYGVRIPEVAWRIQNDVRHAIEEMTGQKVRTVDVVIQGVRCRPGEKPPPAQEESR